MSKGGWYTNPSNPKQKGVFVGDPEDDGLRVAWQEGEPPFPGTPADDNPRVTVCRPDEVEKLLRS